MPAVVSVVVVATMAAPLAPAPEHGVEAVELLLVEHVTDDAHPLRAMGEEELTALRPMSPEPLGQLGHLLVGEVEPPRQEAQPPTRAPPVPTTPMSPAPARTVVI